jgi:hypothetical protein
MAINYLKNNWMVIVAGLLMAPFLIALAPIVFEAGGVLQDRMVPIISDWKVTDSKVEGADLIVSGVMTKNRDCVFLPPTLARDQAGLNHRVISTANAGGTTWAADEQPQKWGPWKVPDGAGKNLVFVNVYLCGSGRPSIIELGAFP